MARYDRVISPGGKGEVVLEIETHRLKGKIRKKASVVSNDPRRPDFSLQLKGEVKTSINISPKNHVRFKTERGKAQSWQFKISSPRKKDFQIVRVESRSQIIRADYSLISGEGNPDGGHVYDLTLTLPSEAPIGNIRDVIKICTDIPGALSAEISLMGKVEGPIRYNPDELTFTPAINEGQASRTVDFYETGGKNFHIKDVKGDLKDLKCEIIPVKNGRGSVLVAIWLGKDTKRIFKGKIMVFTDYEGQDQIEIPYTVFPSSARRGRR